MTAAEAPMMTVFCAETGHVLTAVSAGSIAPSVDDVTGGTYLEVRTTSAHPAVRVTKGLLTAVRVPLRMDVLSDPRAYQVADGRVSLLGAAKPLASTDVLGVAGTATLSLWQVGDSLEEVRDVLGTDGKLSSTAATAPPGAGGGLVLCKGAPLRFRA